MKTEKKHKGAETGQNPGAKSRPAQPWFFNHPEPAVKFAGWLAIFTLVLVVATASGSYFIFRTDETARQAQRAFVAIRKITVTPLGPLQSSQMGAGPERLVYGVTVAWENSRDHRNS